MATASDVAAYVVEKLGACDTMKLQKILYYSQGWHLAWDGVPLFPESIEAWANGPVTPSVFVQHRGRFMIDSWPAGDAGQLSETEQETVQAVIDSYGTLTGAQLSVMTHEERPWIEARGETPAGERSQAPLDLDVMQEYFSSLAAQQ